MAKENSVRIICEEDGRELVVIDEIIFRGRRKIDWRAVKIYLKKYVGVLVKVASTKKEGAKYATVRKYIVPRVV